MYISKLVDPNGVIQILVELQWGLVFKKNMIWAHDVEILDELNRNLKCVFKCMQTCLNYIWSSCAPKNYEILLVRYSCLVEALVKIWESLHV